MDGYIKLWRKVYDHVLHPINRNREWTGFEALIDLIMMAHGGSEPRKIKRGGIDYFVNRGELAITQRQLAERWHWSLDKTNRWLSHLKTERTLRMKPNRWFSLITIENYDIYNPRSERKTERSSRSTPNANRGDVLNTIERNNESNERNISKDIQTTSEGPPRGNEEINKMLIALKGKIGITSFVDSAIERNMAKHCCGLMNKIGRDEFVRRLGLLLEDTFHQKNCNKIKYVYNNIKGFIEPQKKSSIIRPNYLPRTV